MVWGEDMLEVGLGAVVRISCQVLGFAEGFPLLYEKWAQDVRRYEQ